MQNIGEIYRYSEDKLHLKFQPYNDKFRLDFAPFLLKSAAIMNKPINLLGKATSFLKFIQPHHLYSRVAVDCLIVEAYRT